MAILNSVTCINTVRAHDVVVNQTLCAATERNGKTPVSFPFPSPTLYPQLVERDRQPDTDKLSALGHRAGRPASWSGSRSRMSSLGSRFGTSRVGK